MSELKVLHNQAWWCVSVIWAFRMLRKEGGHSLAQATWQNLVKKKGKKESTNRRLFMQEVTKINRVETGENICKSSIWSVVPMQTTSQPSQFSGFSQHHSGPEILYVLSGTQIYRLVLDCLLIWPCKYPGCVRLCFYDPPLERRSQHWWTYRWRCNTVAAMETQGSLSQQCHFYLKELKPGSKETVPRPRQSVC